MKPSVYMQLHGCYRPIHCSWMTVIVIHGWADMQRIQVWTGKESGILSSTTTHTPSRPNKPCTACSHVMCPLSVCPLCGTQYASAAWTFQLVLQLCRVLPHSKCRASLHFGQHLAHPFKLKLNRSRPHDRGVIMT